MRFSLAIILVLTIPDFAYSQNLIPTLEDGKEWEVYRPLGMGQWDIVKYHINCDTVIGGQVYYSTRYSDNTLIGFVREDTNTNIIYRLDTTTMQEEVVVDYNLQIGDTIYYTDPFNYEFVDSVTTEFIFQWNRKVIHINSIVKYIEGVGNSNQGVEVNAMPMFCKVTNMMAYASCTQSPTGVADYIRDIRIYPNPVVDNLYIDIIGVNRPQKLKIYGVSGRMVHESEFAHSIDVSYLNPGLYFLQTDNNLPSKFIKD